MKIVIRSNSWAKLEQATPDEARWLAQLLSYQEERWSGRAYPDRVLDSLLNRYDCMPVGLMASVCSSAREAGLPLTVEDRRVRPCEPDLSADLSWLRDYQLAALEPMRRRMSRGIIKAPTGSGKSECAIGLTRLLPCEWVMLVHRIDLVEQFAQRYLKRTGERAGSFTEGRWRQGTCNLTCASFQSVYSTLSRRDAAGSRAGLTELLEKAQGLLVDESHAQAADTLFAVTQAFESAYYRFGMSGTPLSREDKDSLRTIGALGPLIHRVPTQVLIDRGVLSHARIRMLKLDQGSPETTWRGVHKELVLKSAARNRLVVEMCKQAEKPCLTFVGQVKHGSELARQVQATGIKAAFTNGKDPLEKRQRKIRELVQGGTEVLLCTGIFQEGIDIPELRSVVNAAGGQSEVATIQRLGRGMRTCAEEGKDTFEMWDVLDGGQKWLARHALARKSSYESEGHEVEVI